MMVLIALITLFFAIISIAPVFTVGEDDAAYIVLPK